MSALRLPRGTGLLARRDGCPRRGLLSWHIAASQALLSLLRPLLGNILGRGRGSEGPLRRHSHFRLFGGSPRAGLPLRLHPEPSEPVEHLLKRAPPC
eukprot:8262333-Alexandrium_andersonii.AAC.1